MLCEVIQAMPLPVLQKDFFTSIEQIEESKNSGATAVLMTLATIPDNLAPILFRRIYELGMEAVVEIHTKLELERALALSPTIIGINNRDILKLEKVGIDDNFFDIGGNSLNILQVNKKLNTELETPLPVMTMFRYSTIRLLAEFIGKHETKDTIDRKQRAEALNRGKSDRLKRYQKREQPSRTVDIKGRRR